MGKYSKWSLAALALSASVIALDTAQANIVNGTIWEVATSIAQNATIANLPPASASTGAPPSR